MGYYTNYRVTVKNNDTALDMAMTAKDQNTEQFVASYTGYSDPFSEACKWYDWERDMLKLSSDFPEALFMLEGEGEEAEDIWRAWFMGGKTSGKVKAQIMFPSYSESMLR